MWGCGVRAPGPPANQPPKGPRLSHQVAVPRGGDGETGQGTKNEGRTGGRDCIFELNPHLCIIISLR